MLKELNQVNISTMHELSNCVCVCLDSAYACACVCIMRCMWMQHEMHEVCLECAWHGIEAQNEHNVYKHTSNDQNMSSMFNQKTKRGLELI